MPIYPSTRVIASPTLTGDPTAPTATSGDDDTSVATTEFVTDAIATQAAADAGTYVHPNVVIAGAGIDPTGAIDSTAAIQALLDAAATLFTSCLVWWPEGSYRVNQLVPKSGQTWDGPGKYAVTLQHQQADLSPYDFNMLAPASDLTNFECRNLGFRGSLAAGQSTTGTPGHTGQWWYSTGSLTNVHVHDCYIHDFGDVTSTVGGGFVAVCGSSKRPQNVRIEQCHFENIGRIPGVYISAATGTGYDIVVSDNRFDITYPGTSLQHNAVFVLGWSTGGVIRGVDISNNTFVCNSGFLDDAIEVDYVEDFTISQNRIRLLGSSQVNCGILVRGDCKDGAVTGNTITTTATGATIATGISVLRYAYPEAQRNITITGNSIADIKTKGIYLAQGTTNATVVGNTIEGRQQQMGDGILVVDTKGATISGNVIHGCNHAMRFAVGTDADAGVSGVHFTDNVVKSCGLSGASEFIIGTYTSGISVTNTRIEDNTVISPISGVTYFATTPWLAATGNRISGNSITGLTLLNPSYAKFAGLRAATVTRTGGSLAFTSTSFVEAHTSFNLVITPQVGDWIEVSLSGRWNNEASWGLLDVATIVSGSPITYLSTGTGTGASDGVQAWLGIGGSFSSVGGTILYRVQSADLAADGTLGLRLLAKSLSGTSRSINAGANDPLTFSAKVLA
jgi:hypothetical protein